MNAYTPGIERMMKRLFDSLREMIDGVMPPLKRRSWGMVASSTSRQFLGCDPKTIRQGQTELEEGDDLDTGRVRKKGVAANG